jgi:hypothetical protein
VADKTYVRSHGMLRGKKHRVGARDEFFIFIF